MSLQMDARASHQGNDYARVWRGVHAGFLPESGPLACSDADPDSWCEYTLQRAFANAARTTVRTG